MRVALVAPDLSGRSGWSRYARDLARALAGLGHEVAAAVARPSVEAPCRERAILPAPLACLSGELRRRVAAWRLGRWLDGLEPDVVHFTAEPYALLLPLLARRERRERKTVLTLHGSYAVIPLAQGERTGRLARRTLAEVDRVVAVSRFTSGYLREAFPGVHAPLAREGRIAIVPNGVALPPPPPARLPRGSRETRRILGVGAVKARKGFLEAVDACASFAAGTDLPFRYDVVGSLEEDPRYVARLRARIEERGLAGRVFLRGVLSEEELRRAYREADLFLLLSRRDGMKVEGFGLVFLEANAWGVPVIGPDQGGCPEAIAHGSTGWVCDPTDPGAVAARMREALEEGAVDPGSCRAWAEAHDARRMAERLLEVYRGRAAGGGTAGALTPTPAPPGGGAAPG